VIRQPAIGEADIGAALDEDDLGRLVVAADTRRRGGAARHAADDDDLHSFTPVHRPTPAALGPLNIRNMEYLKAETPSPVLARMRQEYGGFPMAALAFSGFRGRGRQYIRNN
jgi:hypothetical protein